MGGNTIAALIALFVAIAIILTALREWRFRNERRSATSKDQKPLKPWEVDNWIIQHIGFLVQRNERIEDKLNRTLHQQENIMATLDDLVAAAEGEDSKIDSLIALVVALKAKVDAIPGLTAEQQAAIDRAFAAISDNPDRIQAAIDANTPTPPAP